MYDVDSGGVRIGGVDVRDMPQDQLREQVALVPQDVYLFSTTVRDNLVLGRLDAPEPAVRAAADAAIVSSYVEQLPDGFRPASASGGCGCPVGSGSGSRSAGRCSATPRSWSSTRRRPVWTPTTRRRCVRRSRATAGRTTLVIAHRLSTIRSADRLVVLGRGRVVEEGTFDELAAAGGHFAALVKVGFKSRGAG